MMKSKQMQNGNRDENLVLEVFKKNGYWAHNFAKSQSGAQPVDIVAIRENEVWLVDVKNVNSDKVSFPFSRIEPNQLSCFEYARNFAKINNLGIVICFERLDLKPLFMSYDKLLEMQEKGSKSINMADLKPLEVYL